MKLLRNAYFRAGAVALAAAALAIKFTPKKRTHCSGCGKKFDVPKFGTCHECRMGW